ncbi:hypothetical protein [Bacillus sp. 3255]|uniref:hypothetical protein n=1 Tax=Bacillus sp. 3255 TaxID=2817904 RepID=UPI00285F677C|nr:hypothetical protein [Bacillus sp. 3255]MDR6885487.1 hypothetical protein [Bacillus sp. 3255]
MRIPFKQAAISFVLSSSLLISGLPAWADGTDANTAIGQTAAVYTIANHLQVTVEGISTEKIAGGVRIGSVIRTINTSDQTLRVPDFELKVKTASGTEYTLRPSSSNAHGVQPESEVELTFMKVINRQTEVSLSELSLVDVDYDVYPKKETTLFTAPISGNVWNANRGEFGNALVPVKWGETFSIPTVESPLQYKTVDMTKTNSADGVVYLVKLLVTNPSDQSETLPAIQLDGKSSANLYTGKQAESGPVLLDAGESKYVHFAIRTDMDTVLDSLNVLTSENFTQADSSGNTKTSTFTLGKLNLELPSAAGAASSYTYGTPIAFEQWNDVINQDLDVALVELHVADNKDQGSKVAFAKFTLTNKGVSAVPVPAFQTMLSSPSGYDYTGYRQSDVQKTIAPGTSAVVSYGFVLPVAETSDHFTMKVQNEIQGESNAGSVPAFKSTIASYQVTAQAQEDRHEIALYPYKVNIKDYFLSQITSPGQTIALSYTYKLQLYLDLIRDPKVLVDDNFSKLKFELVDAAGSIIGSKTFPFTGTDRLVNGKQTLTFNNLTTDQIQNHVTVNVYEVLHTPTGDVDRLIAELK